MTSFLPDTTMIDEIARALSNSSRESFHTRLVVQLIQ